MPPGLCEAEEPEPAKHHSCTMSPIDLMRMGVVIWIAVQRPVRVSFDYLLCHSHMQGDTVHVFHGIRHSVISLGATISSAINGIYDVAEYHTQLVCISLVHCDSRACEGINGEVMLRQAIRPCRT